MADHMRRVTEREYLKSAGFAWDNLNRSWIKRPGGWNGFDVADTLIARGYYVAWDASLHTRALTEQPSWAGHDIPVYWSDAERRQPPAGGGGVHGPFPRVSAFYTVTGSAPQRDFSFILGTARWQEEAK